MYLSQNKNESTSCHRQHKQIINCFIGEKTAISMNLKGVIINFRHFYLILVEKGVIVILYQSMELATLG